MGKNRDLAYVKKSNSSIALLFFVLTFVTSGSTYTFVTDDLDPNFNAVSARAKPICSDGSHTDANSNCYPAVETPGPSLEQQLQLQQPICSDGSHTDANSNCPYYIIQGIGHGHRQTH
jgi:hypothetical protein